MINDIFTLSREEIEDLVNKSCKSKYCTDALLSVYKSKKDKTSFIEEMITKLESKECRDQNSANSLKIGSSLVLTFAMFLVLLF